MDLLGVREYPWNVDISRQKVAKFIGPQVVVTWGGYWIKHLDISFKKDHILFGLRVSTYHTGPRKSGCRLLAQP